MRFLFIILSMFMLTGHAGAQETQRVVVTQDNYAAPIAPHEEPNARVQNERDEISEYWNLLGHRLKITDTLLVLFTLLLSFATGALWWSTRKLVQGADRTAERQLRAYISVDNGPIAFRQAKRALFEFRLHITNNGLTPANNVRIISNVAITNSNIPIGFDYSLTDLPMSSPFRSVTSVAPRQSMFHSRMVKRMPVSELRLISSGENIFHVWGQVIYDDIYLRNRQTNFSFIIFAARRRQEAVWHRTEEHNNSN
ncbi:hypothetical protein NKH49_20950 [Mesorhizobium sp. M1088]|uniref:hypothetical protein n=1 Tax=Mesorhizobium sp. M1088 TaxID=2957056 RepID=UPI0033378BD1